MTHRFFIPSEWLTPPIVSLAEPVAHQLKNVLRLRPGAEIIVLDNSGRAWRVELTDLSGDSVQGRLLAEQPVDTEPTVQVSLYQGTLKGQKFEWVLQKGTELGVSSFVPTICQRSIVRQRSALLKKYERWEQIIREAAEQSGRGRLPRLADPLALDKALARAQAASLMIMPWEEVEEGSLRATLAQRPSRTVALFIGSEGGFTPEEAALAQRAGARLVKLGPRILRAETAGLAACAAILYELGEWQ